MARQISILNKYFNIFKIIFNDTLYTSCNLDTFNAFYTLRVLNSYTKLYKE